MSENAPIKSLKFGEMQNFGRFLPPVKNHWTTTTPVVVLRGDHKSGRRQATG